MSDSNRNSITYTWLAACSALLLLVGYLIIGELRNAEPTVADEYEASRYADRAQDRINRICVGLTGVELLHCEYEVKQPERENYRAQKDLRAQWYMAIWAGFMTLFTLGTLIVTGLGVYFVRLTLHQAATTNEAAVKAAVAANKSNEIMLQQSAGYLIIENVEIQAQTDFVLILATVRNIGHRPVRMAEIKGRVIFDWDTISEDGIPARRTASTKAKIFIGVVEQGQTAKGVSAAFRRDFTNVVDDYVNHILRADGAEFICDVSWSENMSPLTSERHILHTSNDNEVFDPSKGNIISLKVAYSGYAMDLEKRAAKTDE